MNFIKRAMQGSAKRRPPVVKGLVSPMRSVPSHIIRPSYADSGNPPDAPRQIKIYDKAAYDPLRESAMLAREMLEFACALSVPGITCEEVDQITHQKIIERGAYPSPINYATFPKAICTSVNEVVCHGIPDDRVLQEGDMLSIDVSVFLNGYHGDNCKTIIIGGTSKGDDVAVKLINTTNEALALAIATCKPGSCLSEIGGVIESHAKTNGFNVIHEMCGHGTGSILHMSPLVQHFRNNNELTLQPGMVFTIEPILVEGSRRIYTWEEDGWSIATFDSGRGAQEEHEVLITEDGVEVLTVTP